MDEGAKVLFDYVIHHLSLAICLRVVGSAHLERGAIEFEQFLPKFADEEEIAIRDEASGHAVDFADGFHE